jgi:hypothetical protein
MNTVAADTAFVACASSAESHDVGFAHAVPAAPPSTPKHQPTKAASPVAPVKCKGCEEEQPNQLAHIGVGGCLEDAFNLVAQ